MGARYAWEGNRNAGKGNMEIVASTPERVELRLTFEKPWKATNRGGDAPLLAGGRAGDGGRGGSRPPRGCGFAA